MSMAMEYPWTVEIWFDGKWVQHASTFASKRFAKKFCKSINLRKGEYRILKTKGK